MAKITRMLLQPFVIARKNFQIDIQSRFKRDFCYLLANFALKSNFICFLLAPYRMYRSVKKSFSNSISIFTFPFSGKLPAN